MTDDDKALVEQLEALAVNSEGQDDWLVMSDAADRIEALSEENERLLDLLNHVADQADHDCETMWITDIIRAALGETK